MRITREGALNLLRDADLLDLGEMADKGRIGIHEEGIVTFVVDRNINYTNVCINKCRFCAFYRDVDSPDAYLLTEEDIFRKIEETLQQGGTQILIQGGLHPGLEIDFYLHLLESIRERFKIHVHGFSPPEISYIAEKQGLSIRETLGMMKEAGLGSIPGGGAEILSDRVRSILSPRKIKSSHWLKVMEEAHQIGLRTTATMMFGSVEGYEDIIEHLDRIRSLQDRTGGFTAFIPWSFQPGNTMLSKEAREGGMQSMSGEQCNGHFALNQATAVDYLRVLAISRVYLDNIRNIQASWVTQGLKLAQVALRFGANDFGSTMIEENVVASTGVRYRVSKDDIIEAIRSAGFRPAQRDTLYNIIRVF
jgi:cyclic dehypoxanthinyl futalosine synthase